jgi:hypothetical protein
MHAAKHARLYLTLAIAISFLLSAIEPNRPLLAQTENSSTEPTNMTVVVREYDSGQPVSQAHVTLQFFVPHGPTIPRKGKRTVYNAKTDTQGRCKLSGINKGSIVLTVTADGHQSYGKELRLEKDNQVFEVRLKRPQPLI